MDAQADEAAVSGKRPADEAVPELAQLVMQLRNVVNMEREHADKLFAHESIGLREHARSLELVKRR